MAIVFNPVAARTAALSERALARFTAEAAARPLAALSRCPAHAETPLIALPGLAARLGVKQVWFKDERGRMGLGSFKALGGAYAVMRRLEDALSAELGRPPAPDALIGDTAKRVAKRLTVTAATDGNHGLSVAAGARVFGLNCVIFVHARVGPDRIARIEAEGAQVRVVDGLFDDAVAAARNAGATDGWAVIGDTALDPDDPHSGEVVQGYAALAHELDGQLERAGAQPSHVFIQAGVGGLAAAVFAGLALQRGSDRPCSIWVEPETAPALFASVQAGEARRAPDAGPTAMEMLDCHAPSALAFETLNACADAFQTVTDARADAAAALLARPKGGDPALPCTPTAAAGLAGLTAALEDPGAAKRLGLGADSEVVLMGTEGLGPYAA